MADSDIDRVAIVGVDILLAGNNGSDIDRVAIVGVDILSMSLEGCMRGGEGRRGEVENQNLIIFSFFWIGCVNLSTHPSQYTL